MSTKTGALESRFSLDTTDFMAKISAMLEGTKANSDEMQRYVRGMSRNLKELVSVAEKTATATGAIGGSTAKLDAFTASLKRQIETFGKGQTDIMRYDAAQLGAGSSVAHLILQLEQQQAAQRRAADAAREEAAAQREVAAARGVVSSLKERVATQGLSEADRLRRQVAALPLGDAEKKEAAAYIAEIEKFNATTVAGARSLVGMSVASREARVEANLLKNANRQLAFQITDVVTSLSSGMPAYMVLIQQGGQIKDMYGGIVPAFRAVANLLTPLRLGMMGAAAAVGTLGFAYYTGTQQSKDFANAMALSGNLAGMTEGRFNSLVKSLSDRTRVGASDVREMLQAVAESGLSAFNAYENTGRAALALSKVSGKTAAESIKAFAGIESGVTAWAEKANRAYSFLTPEIYRQIAALESQGKIGEAVDLAMGKLSDTLEKRTVRSVGMLESALKTATRWWGAFTDAATGIGRSATNEESIAVLEKEIEVLRRNKAAAANSDVKQAGVGDETLRRLEAQLAALKAVPAAIAAQAAADKANNDAILEQTREYYDARTRITQAAADRDQAVMQDALAKQRKALEGAYALRLIDAKVYRDAMFRNTLDALRAERSAAQTAVTVVEGRTARTVPEIRQKEADTIVAQTKVKQVDAKIAAARFEFDAGDPKVVAAFTAELEKRSAETARMILDQEKLRAGDVWASEQVKKLTEGVLGLTEAQRASFDARVESARVLLNDAEATRALGAWVLKTEEGTREIEAQTAALELGTLAKQQAAAAEKLLADAEKERRTNPQFSAEINDELGRQAKRRSDALAEAYDRSRDPTSAARQTMRSYVEDATNGAKQVENAITGSMKRMEDAMISWAKTGKLSFSDLFSFLAEEYLRSGIRNMLAGGMTRGGGDTSAGFSLMTLFSSFAGSHAYGLDRVPYDGYPAVLHKDERVLTANQVRASSGQSVHVDFRGQVLHIGQGVSRSEVAAALARNNAIVDQNLRRRMREGVMS